jgi:hypothetical protein
VTTMLDLAAGRLTEVELAEWTRNSVKPRHSL